MKAACGKSARAVWAADGGQRASAPPPTRHSREWGRPERTRAVNKSGGLRNRLRQKTSSVWPAGRHGEGEAQLDRPARDRTVAGNSCTQNPACALSAQAQLAEPPYADPHVRWCGRGERETAPPIPIALCLPLTGAPTSGLPTNHPESSRSPPGIPPPFVSQCREQAGWVYNRCRFDVKKGNSG